MYKGHQQLWCIHFAFNIRNKTILYNPFYAKNALQFLSPAATAIIWGRQSWAAVGSDAGCKNAIWIYFVFREIDIGIIVSYIMYGFMGLYVAYIYGTRFEKLSKNFAYWSVS